MPGGDFLHPEHGVVGAPQADELAAAGAVYLPGDWWVYAVGFLGNSIVKASVYPRREQGELSQAEIDEIELPERLDLVFGVA